MSLDPLASLGAASDDVLRELRYCERAFWAWQLGGRVGAAQSQARDQGWLSPCPTDPRRLQLTPAGRAVLRAMPPPIKPAARSRRTSSTPSRTDCTASIDR